MAYYTDGEWYHSVVDDRLYLESPEYNGNRLNDNLIPSKAKISEQEYQSLALTGSRALYFTAASDPNETWLPLMEKSYARAHGDYGAIRNFYIGQVFRFRSLCYSN